MTLLYLVRHGQTEWSKSGQHTSFTDLDLTEHGVKQATALRERLDPSEFGLVLTSPRTRARHTAELAGFTDYEVTDDLQEWNYGDYEGKTSLEIREHHHPGWRLWFNGVPNGESAEQVRERVRREGVDLRGDRSLTLRYIPHNRAPLDKGRKEVLKHVHRLWGFDVMLEQQNEDGSVELLERCPPRMNGL